MDELKVRDRRLSRRNIYLATEEEAAGEAFLTFPILRNEAEDRLVICDSHTVIEQPGSLDGENVVRVSDFGTFLYMAESQSGGARGIAEMCCFHCFTARF